MKTNEADQDSKELSDHMSVSDLKTELLEILSSADESVKSIMNSRRRKDEPSKKAGQNERANDSGKQTRLRATDENLRANASVLPRRRNPISFRPTEAQLRQSQSELSAVSFELRELSLTLSIKSEQLKLKERDIEAREAALDRYDEKVEKNASELFRLWKTSFEESIKKELDAFIRKYESALARTSRENRRLLANNVELGRSSKDFRDQV
ncbi:hypothetical protein DFJ73DRAFT_141833 [Zopfochytrium polystomum]|nr:hypothetical protein DFJ73DRAFT_141833 [Zopfochytrium polystomum]